MATKTHPELVIVERARAALAKASSAGAVYSEYIRLSFQQTGRLAPGCDARDLVAWCQTNEPATWAALAERKPAQKGKKNAQKSRR